MLFVRDFLSDQQIFRSPQAPENPLVSVILPTYARYKIGSLQRAVQSVLSQTFEDFELIIVDDGSRDGSADFIEACRSTDPRVIQVRHEQNSGLPALRVNEGIELARGRYLAFQFDDDSWRPHALATFVAESNCRSENVVVIGHCHARGRAHELILPVVTPNLSSLYENNCVANNSVFVPRLLVECFGMYDCHIAMRRVCDWDLWVRLIKRVPFVVLEEIIADVFAEQPDSVAMTMPYDLSLIRYFQAISRDHLLTPRRWRDYEVDGLRVGDVEIENDLRRRLYEKHIVPYYLKFRHRFPQVEGFSVTLPPRRKTVLYASHSCDATQDIGLNPYDPLANRRGSYKASFQFQHQVGPGWVRETDILLLIRPFLEQAKTLMAQALRSNVPVGLYLDDDLLTLHEYGAEFNAFAPGAEKYHHLVDMLRQADTVWATSRFIKESVSPFNPRTVPHNGAIECDWLPTALRPRRPGQPLRIGYVGANYRIEEFRYLWEALVDLSREYKDQLVFEFWGLDIASLPPLSSPTVQRPFIYNYCLYLQQLRDAQFDILLTPLLDSPRPRLAKAPSKYYQTAVAGALGIFSNVPPYERLHGGLTCLKPNNTVEEWRSALLQAVTMPPEQFDVMRQRMLQHVREEFTESAQIHLHEAALRATEFHAKTRAGRSTDGRPRILVPSAAIEKGRVSLGHHVELLQRYGIEPIVVFVQTDTTTSSSSERRTFAYTNIQVEWVRCSPFDNADTTVQQEIRNLLTRYAPVLVHANLPLPVFGKVCRDMGIPYVAALPTMEERTFGQAGSLCCTIRQTDTWHSTNRCDQVLGGGNFCTRGIVSQGFFDLSAKRHFIAVGEKRGASPEDCLHIVLVVTAQEEQKQRDALEAVRRLSREGVNCRLAVYADSPPLPSHTKKWCQQMWSLGLGRIVTFNEYTEDDPSLFQAADVLLNLSNTEKFPQTVKEAMASGVLVVTTPEKAVTELVIDKVSGILCTDTSVEAIVEGLKRAALLSPAEWESVVHQAYRVARSEFHPDRAANDLMSMYAQLVEMHGVSGLCDREEVRMTTSGVSDQRAIPLKDPMRASQSFPVGYRPMRGRLRYRLEPQCPRWKGVQIWIRTALPQVRGRLAFRICLGSGPVVREGEVNFVAEPEGSKLTLEFVEIAHAEEQAFVLKLALREPEGAELRIGETSRVRSRLQRTAWLLGISPVQGNLCSQLMYA